MILDPTFWVNALQLLVSLYQVKSARAEQTQVLIDIREEIRLNPPDDPKAFIQERIAERLPALEAAEVQADLSTISLLNVAPIEVSAFDYWSLLQTLLTRVREFCHHHSVFRFRGLGQTVGSRILELPKTATALFDQDTRGCWQDVRYPNSYASRGTREAKLYLVEKPTNPIFGYGGPESVTLPVIGEVAAQYIKFNSTGYDGPPPVHTEAVTVYALPGPDVHWLLFKSPENSRVCVIRAQRMLTSPEVFEIVSSVRHDLIMRITGLTADQQFSGTTLQSALRELMSQVPASE